jgi:hypothetical protein
VNETCSARVVLNKLLNLSLVVALCAPGCSFVQTNLASDGGKFYAVKAEKTSFYKYGPQQGNGPDMELPKDTLMTLIRPSFGYCKVHLTSGQEGYVANEDIDVAPPALVATVSEPPPGAEPTRHSERFNLNSTDPRLVVPPEDLPENNPEPTPLPGTSPN